MKITKIPSLGRFGIFIDDVDFNTMSKDQWLEIGQLHLDNLVTIIRNTNLDQNNYQSFIEKFGTIRDIHQYNITKKYNNFLSRLLKDPSALSEEDRVWLEGMSSYMLITDNGPSSILKITGMRDDEGKPLGMFTDGELAWHSNEAANLSFTPGVSLLSNQGMVGSATGFITTTDYYESVSESFRSELDEMVVLHRFTPGKMTPGLNDEQDQFMCKNMCAEDDMRMPMVMNSPGGIKGLHYSINTMHSIEGMSVEESEKLFTRINKELFVDKYIYDHWYKGDNDLCLFDNSITLHRRLGDISNRMAYRIQHDYNNLRNEPYIPYLQEEFNTRYISDMKAQISTLHLDNNTFDNI